MTEHVKGALPQLEPLDKEIGELQNTLIELKLKRQEIINNEARKVAKYTVGHEFERGRRKYVVTEIQGDYYDSELDGFVPVVWVRYKGRRMFKKGTQGTTETVYPGGF